MQLVLAPVLQLCSEALRGCAGFGQETPLSALIISSLKTKLELFNLLSLFVHSLHFGAVGVGL